MSSNKVFLGNLNWRVTNDSLTQFLRNEGYEFRSVRVILDRDTNRSRGFAFIEFDTPEAADEAMAGLDGAELEGRPLQVEITRGPKGQFARRLKDILRKTHVSPKKPLLDVDAYEPVVRPVPQRSPVSMSHLRKDVHDQGQMMKIECRRKLACRPTRYFWET